MIKYVKENPSKFINETLTFEGWISKHRIGKKISFLILRDGSTLEDLQIVYKDNLKDYKEINKWFIGSAIKVTGKIIKAKNEKEIVELILEKGEMISATDENYFLQNKKHSLEFLRNNSDLRARTKLFQSVFSIRSSLFFFIHEYFQKNNYHYLTSPIITNNDCEGAGESFFVNNTIDNKELFFKKVGKLTVSGQLHAEAFAQAFKKVYTFGPTFRADKSNTRIHASEFWMIEPEVAFFDLWDCLEMTEDFLKFSVQKVIDKHKKEIIYLSKKNKINLIERLENFVSVEWMKIEYKEAIEILKKHKDVFNNKNIKWGMDLEKEHEMFFCNKYNKPVFVVNYPKKIKSFYMKINEDGETVRSFDLFVSGIGEMVGGSQREDNYDVLLKKMKNKNVDMESLTWYLNLRKNGFGRSTGFGLGFDRLLLFITGIDNIRDVVPFYIGYKTLNF